MNMDSSKSNKDKNTDSSPPPVHASITAQPLPPKPKTALVIEAKVVSRDKLDPPNNEVEEKTSSNTSKNQQFDIPADQDSGTKKDEGTTFDHFQHEDSSSNDSVLTEVDESLSDLQSKNSFRNKLTPKPEPEVGEICTQILQKKKKWKLLSIIALLLLLSIPALIFFSDILEAIDNNYINTQSIKFLHGADSSLQK